MRRHSLQEMHELQPHPDLLTARDVARLLGVDTATVYRMAGDGRLPGVRVGRQWRFPNERVRAALRRGLPAASNPAERPSDGRAPGWSDPQLVSALAGFTADALGVMLVVTDMEGRPITPILNPCPAIANRLANPGVLATCTLEWRTLATDLDFEPRFRLGAMGFECARALIRSGSELVGTVLAGGLAAAGSERPDDGLYHLDDARRRTIVRLLPRLAAVLSRLAGHPDAAPDPQGGSR
jgi:excisionase family DNA binding protein